MDVRLSDEQLLLFETAQRIAEGIGTDTTHALDQFDDARAWQTLADAGLLALLVPEPAGGMGAEIFEVALIAEALSRSTAAVPFLGSAVLATELLAIAGAEDKVMERLADGSLRLAVGLHPSLRRLATAGDRTVIGFDAAGASAVLVADDAGALRALATNDADCLDATDMTRSLISLRRSDASHIDLGSLGFVDADRLTRWEARSLPVVAADLVGVMDGALSLAVGYACERKQFGVPIGSFQAVQHLCAEQKVSLEASRSSTWFAAWCVDHRPLGEALIAARSAKAFCARAGREVTEAAIQVHGGIGITWECAAHIFLKRALLTRQVLGDEHEQLNALARARYGELKT